MKILVLAMMLVFSSTKFFAASEERTKESLQRHECCVCMEKKDRLDFWTSDCKHPYCVTCFIKCITTSGETSEISKPKSILCPICRQQIAPRGFINIITKASSRHTLPEEPASKSEEEKKDEKIQGLRDRYLITLQELIDSLLKKELKGKRLPDCTNRQEKWNYLYGELLYQGIKVFSLDEQLGDISLRLPDTNFVILKPEKSLELFLHLNIIAVDLSQLGFTEYGSISLVND